MTHASESQHWYTRTGEPAYEMKGANSNMRAPTLRDARKLGLVPGVSTIIRCADRPGLTNWMIDQAILAALTLPKLQGEAEKDYLARIKRDSKEQARKAAERGTAIHAAIQGFYSDETPQSGYELYIQGAVQAVAEWQKGAWVAERSFSHPMGFGGKVDLSGVGVIDFKTKEFDTFGELKTWDEHAMQLAAYRHGLGLEKARCAIVYVSTTVPGLAKLIEITEEELQRGWTCFYALLHFWQAKSSYRSAFEPQMVAA